MDDVVAHDSNYVFDPQRRYKCDKGHDTVVRGQVCLVGMWCPQCVEEMFAAHCGKIIESTEIEISGPSSMAEYPRPR